MSKIKNVLEQVGDGVLTEEAQQVIIEAFEEAVETRVTERVEAEVTNVVKQIDEDHAIKLEKLIEAIDEDHSQKLLNVLAKIDEDHSNKLKTVINRYNHIIKEEAGKFRDTFVDEISNYLELYLDRVVPANQIAEATKNSQARRMIEQVKKIVAVDKAFINENVREALKDGKDTIDGLRKELNKVIKENVQLNKQYNKTAATLILEKKTENLPKEKRQFVMRVLEDKSPEYIKENFNYVVEMYNRDEQETRELIKEEVQQSAVSRNVESPKSILESVSRMETSDGSGDPSLNGYLAELKRFDKR